MAAANTDFCARSNVTPPPATTPSSIAALVVRHCIFDAVLLLFELDLGGRADLEHRNTAGKLGQTLLELLAVVVAVGVLDLGLDLLDATVDLGLVAGTLDDRRLVLGHDDLASLTEHVERGASTLRPTSSLMTWPPVRMAMSCSIALRRSPKPGALTATDVERAADLVDHERGQRFAFDIFGDDHERLAGLHDLFEHRHEVTHGSDLGADEQDVGVVEHCFHAIGVGDEVGRDVALVEAHTFDEVHLHAEGL